MPVLCTQCDLRMHECKDLLCLLSCLLLPGQRNVPQKHQVLVMATCNADIVESPAGCCWSQLLAMLGF